MSNVAPIGSFVWVYFHLLHLFNFCSLNSFIYVVLGYHIRWWYKVVDMIQFSVFGSDSYWRGYIPSYDNVCSPRNTVAAGMWSRSRGLGLETVSRTNNVSSRSRPKRSRAHPWVAAINKQKQGVDRPICIYQQRLILNNNRLLQIIRDYHYAYTITLQSLL